MEEDIKTLDKKKIEEDYPLPTPKEGSSEEEEEEEEVELPPEDTVAEDRARYRYEQIMRLK